MIGCPSCGSSAVAKQATAKKVGAAIGGVSGVLNGLSATTIGANIILIAGSPTGGPATAVGRLASSIMAAFVSGAAGCITGARIGELIDRNVFDSYRCIHCNCSFSMHMPATSMEALHKVEATQDN